MFCCDNNNCKEIKEYCRRHVHEALEKRVNKGNIKKILKNSHLVFPAFFLYSSFFSTFCLFVYNLPLFFPCFSGMRVTFDRGVDQSCKSLTKHKI